MLISDSSQKYNSECTCGHPFKEVSITKNISRNFEIFTTGVYEWLHWFLVCQLVCLFKVATISEAFPFILIFSTEKEGLVMHEL